MRILAVDVGCGTSDVLLWDSQREAENQTHLIIPSATQVVAAEIERATKVGRPVVFVGRLMGGGPNARAMRRHVAHGLPFYATAPAARSFNDDLQAVAAMGVTVIEPRQVAGLLNAGAAKVRSGDVRSPELLRALVLLGESRDLDGCALAVQDHGHADPGVSDRMFRFQKMAEQMARSRRLADFFYGRDEIPAHFTRMRAAAGLMSERVPLVVSDTGPAALWGASSVASTTPCLVVNFGNNHTLMAAVDGETVDGLFEHHTSMLDPTKMEGYVRRFAAGELKNEDVFNDGGHGTLCVSRPLDLSQTEIVVTGPRRSAFMEMDLPLVEAAPHGDMMLTGCYGLIQGFLSRG
jgi:uncharacterized protein (DUF1786 family)